MSFIEVTVMGKTGFVATESIVAVLSNVNTSKAASVIYMEEPVGALEVDESAEEVYELIYEASPSGEDDDEQEEDYEASLEDMQEAYELLMLSAWTPAKEDT
jgi:hypothetical protein